MRHTRSIVAGASAAIALSACTTGQLNVTPPLQFTPTSAVLRLSVGTVNYAGLGVGLNVYETDRAPSGYTAIPDNTAVLKGPAGFAGPAGSADPGSNLASVPLGAAGNSFAIGAGATSLAAAAGTGIGPPGSSTGTINAFPVQPQFFDKVPGDFSAQRALYGGPPAYPPPSNPGPAGYPEGFYLVSLTAAPPTGVYTLTVSYSQNGNAGTQMQTATLASNALLAPLTTPTYTTNGAGGGSGTVILPAGVVEVIVNVTDSVTGATGTAVVHGAGTSQPYVIPSSVGLGVGNTLIVQAFGFDYNDAELGPPFNLAQSPALPAQADVTVAPEGSPTE